MLPSGTLSAIYTPKALPSKPVNIIALSDADSVSALSLVRQKLQDAQIDINFGREETSLVERLGGRAEDLESVSRMCIRPGSLN